MSSEESFDPTRFRDAQEAGGCFERALAELRAGEKTSHWIWYVFPQLEGLGRSGIARRFGLAGREHAEGYLREPVLRQRLLAAAEAVREQLCERGARLPVLMGSHVDALKLVSSMTLFEAVARGIADEDPECERLAEVATAILEAAAAQGHAPCAFTRSGL